MRILIVIPSLTRAGAETQAVDLANGLAQIGHNVHLCSFERQLDQRSRLDNIVHFHHLQRKSKYDVSLPIRLAELIDQEKIDVMQGVLLFATLIAALASKRSTRRPPVVAAIHSTIIQGRKSKLIDRILYRYVLRTLHAIVFVSENQREYWIRKYPEIEPLACVIHNGVDPCKFRRDDFLGAARKLRAALAIPEGAFVFSCVAGFRPVKGHRYLIEAFGQMPADTYLLLAGDGETRSAIESAVRLAKVDERVRFLGTVEEVRSLIVASDATVLSSTSETFPMAMLESMALGVTMIGPSIGGLPEAILEGETGLLFKVGDIDDLSRQMRTLVADPATTRRMGQAAQKLVADKFTKAAMIARSEQLLIDVQARSCSNSG